MSGTRAHGTLRPIDLARLAGVSTQLIRNYEDDGVLPPVPRSPSGYRRYSARHRAAVLTYRALARGYGRPAAQAVMRAVHTGRVPEALALIDAGHAELHGERQALQEVERALDGLAGHHPEPAGPGDRFPLRIGEVAARLGLRTSALRVWESAGLLAPEREAATGYRWYGPAELRDARLVQLLRRGGYPLPRIRTVLDGLRRTGSSAELRTALARRAEELTHRSRAMLDGSGRLHTYLADADACAPGDADAYEAADAPDAP
ncbi:MerR family transcriptional regulator [Streptomyces sp. NRRL F-4489]|uniref:MerR family transcriptional regulator n=1 Tax=Streptomyces sp. NRRL F-4489 TaxID=1609095 RepID=UPI00074642A8|nr:MerR family transcriptional regulator [Streptomyces sp. NRRL F-4489]KUL36320.1 MerR family transcriptional regulator [Streptomyces sp. NRRL F-4489]